MSNYRWNPRKTRKMMKLARESAYAFGLFCGMAKGPCRYVVEKILNHTFDPDVRRSSLQIHIRDLIRCRTTMSCDSKLSGKVMKRNQTELGSRKSPCEQPTPLCQHFAPANLNAGKALP